MMNRRNRLRRAALLLALLVLVANVTGVAASATKTLVPKQLSGFWRRSGWQMGVRSSGKVYIFRGMDGRTTRFSHVTAHRLTANAGGAPWSCSGTGTYRWKVANRKLTLTKIRDTCEPRVGLLAGTWRRTS